MSTFKGGCCLFDPLHYAAHRKWILFLSCVAVVVTFLITSDYFRNFLPGLAISHDIFVNLAVSYFTLCLCLLLSNIVKKIVICEPRVDPSDKAVLVTGSASGFGNELVKKLDSLGFTVFACLRDLGDDRAKKLRESSSSRVHLIRLDVTQDDQVDEAVKTIKNVLEKEKKILWSVVANAGVYYHSPWDWGNGQGYENVMKTNAFGVVRLVKAFCPLLKKVKGSRIVVTSSIAAVIPGPLIAPYSMSKNALRAFSTSLRLELRPFDVYVTQVQPVYYGTPLVDISKITKELEHEWTSTPQEIRETYSEKLKDRITRFTLHMLEMKREDPGEVVEVLAKVVSTSREPDHVVSVGGFWELSLMSFVHLFPSEMLDYAYYFPRGHGVLTVMIRGSRLFYKLGRLLRRMVMCKWIEHHLWNLCWLLSFEWRDSPPLASERLISQLASLSQSFDESFVHSRNPVGGKRHYISSSIWLQLEVLRWSALVKWDNECNFPFHCNECLIGD